MVYDINEIEETQEEQNKTPRAVRQPHHLRVEQHNDWEDGRGMLWVRILHTARFTTQKHTEFEATHSEPEHAHQPKE